MVCAAHSLPRQALECLARAEKLDDREARWPFHQGVLLQDDGRPEEALGKLRRAVELCGNKPDAPRLRLAELLLNQGYVEAAAVHFRGVLESDADNPRAHLGLGRIALAGEDLTAALGHLRRALASPCTARAALSLQSQVYQSQGQPAAAAAALRQAGARGDDLPWPDPYIEEVVRLNVSEAALCRRAELSLRRGRPDEALAALEEPLRLYPDSPVCHTLAGQALVKLEQWEAAGRAFRRVLELQPDNAEAHVYLGILAAGRGDWPAATAAFRRAIRLKPADPNAYCNLAQALLYQYDEGGAIEALRGALRRAPNMAEAHARLGELLARSGRTAEARTHLRAAVTLDPKDLASKKRLADLEQ
jgi:superkiller protein 3